MTACSGMNDDQDPGLTQAVRLRELGTPEGCERLRRLSDSRPRHAGVAYQTAWAHDTLGLETEAAPYYERALAGQGLSAADRHGAFLGLGSTYRVLGRYGEAVAVLRRSLVEFPEDAALRTFLAMALHNTGESAAAVQLLLQVTAATSADPTVRQYRRAIEYYADHLDETS